MSDEDEKPQDISPDPEEEKFWERFRKESDATFEASFGRWVERESAKIDEEESKNAKEEKDDPEPAGRSGDPERREPSDAERQWESGRAGARESLRSKYYKRWGRKALYGK